MPWPYLVFPCRAARASARATSASHPAAAAMRTSPAGRSREHHRSIRRDGFEQGGGCLAGKQVRENRGIDQASHHRVILIGEDGGLGARSLVEHGP